MDEKVLEFVIFCIESLAEKLNIDAINIYRLVRFDTDVLDRYIIPSCKLLHS